MYCYAISLMINGATSAKAYKMTRAEVKHPKIKGWFKYEIEAGDIDRLTSPHSKNIGHLKIAFVWAFYFLKDNWSYD